MKTVAITTGTCRMAAIFLICTVLCASTAQASGPAECGDIDGDGAVVAVDALMVLRKAVGLPGAYLCLVAGSTTSTTQEVIGDCFSDQDCEGSPAGAHCCAYECAVCENDDHCAQGEYCSSGCECLPVP